MENTNDDRRIHPRIPILLMVEYDSLSDFFVDYATDISQGGMFVITREKLGIGAQVNVKFTLPGESGALEAAGTVVRKTEKPSVGVGIRFDPLPDNAKSAIERLWESKIQE